MSSSDSPVNIKSFVRNTLGCTCPDAIFDKQEIENGIAINGIENCTKLCVGNKLLIYIVPVDSIHDFSTSLPCIIQEGRGERDSRNLNRFRLVLVANDADAVIEEALMVIESIDNLDEKIHLHILPGRVHEILR